MLEPFPQGDAGAYTYLVWYSNDPPNEEQERAARKVRLRFGEE